MSERTVLLDTSWKDRSLHWEAESQPTNLFNHRSRRRRQPLIINGHGSYISVDNGCLIIRAGFTHHPQKSRILRFFPNDKARPSQILVLDGSGALSFHALDWLARNNVPLVRINWRGRVHMIIGEQFKSAAKSVSKQNDGNSENETIGIATSLIRTKIKNCAITLNSVIPRSNSRKVALSKLKGYLAYLSSNKVTSISRLMGIEGGAALAYFSAWQGLPIKWKGTKRKPIPEDWYSIGLRSSVTRLKTKNRNASHPVNAMLNYGYAVLESQVRMQIVADGQNPKVGVLHKSRPDREALVLDLMEPLRPVVDGKVLKFIESNTFEPADFMIRPDGNCRLHPSLASAVVSMANVIK